MSSLNDMPAPQILNSDESPDSDPDKADEEVKTSQP